MSGLQLLAFCGVVLLGAIVAQLLIAACKEFLDWLDERQRRRRDGWLQLYDNASDATASSEPVKAGSILPGVKQHHEH